MSLDADLKLTEIILFPLVKQNALLIVNDVHSQSSFNAMEYRRSQIMCQYKNQLLFFHQTITCMATFYSVVRFENINSSGSSKGDKLLGPRMYFQNNKV